MSMLSIGIWEQHTAPHRRFTGATLASGTNTYGRHLQTMFAGLTPEQLVMRLRESETLFDQVLYKV